VTVAPDVEGHQTFRELLTFYSFQPTGNRIAARAGWSYTITVVPEDGLAYWNRPFKEATWAEVRRGRRPGSSAVGESRALTNLRFIAVDDPGALAAGGSARPTQNSASCSSTVSRGWCCVSATFPRTPPTRTCCR
jgi:hypothetical protein